MDEKNIPLGTCKQACMKLESAMADIMELCEDDNFSDEQKEKLQSFTETLGCVEAGVHNIICECGVDGEFLSEDIDMDTIDEYPEGVEEDILDTPLEE